MTWQQIVFVVVGAPILAVVGIVGTALLAEWHLRRVEGRRR